MPETKPIFIFERQGGLVPLVHLHQSPWFVCVCVCVKNHLTLKHSLLQSSVFLIL